MFETSSESETIIIRLAGTLAEKNFLLALVAGVVLAGILACTMSTADSQLLTAASSVPVNLLQDFLKIKMEPKTVDAGSPSDRCGDLLVAVGSGMESGQTPYFTSCPFAWGGLWSCLRTGGIIFLYSGDALISRVLLAGMLTGGVMGVCMEIPG